MLLFRYQRIDKLIAAIRADAELPPAEQHFDMADWFNWYNVDFNDVLESVIQNRRLVHCGTTACVAGTACILFAEKSWLRLCMHSDLDIRLKALELLVNPRLAPDDQKTAKKMLVNLFHSPGLDHQQVVDTLMEMRNLTTDDDLAMTKHLFNHERLLAVKEKIRQDMKSEVKHFSMATWFDLDAFDDEPELKELETTLTASRNPLDCGTSACMAGFTYIMYAPNLVLTEDTHICDAAIEALTLVDENHDAFLDAANNLHRIFRATGATHETVMDMIDDLIRLDQAGQICPRYQQAKE